MAGTTKREAHDSEFKSVVDLDGGNGPSGGDGPDGGAPGGDAPVGNANPGGGPNPAEGARPGGACLLTSTRRRSICLGELSIRWWYWDFLT